MIDAAPPTRTATVTCMIACAVFKPALEHLRLTQQYSQLRVVYLPSRLHNMPQQLQSRLLKEVIKQRKRGERTICLYGECFPEMNEFCERHSMARVSGTHCDEILLGHERFHTIIQEESGTYFLERDLIVNFGRYCRRPLELDDIEIREALFRHYRRLLYLRQPSDGNLIPQIRSIADFLGLPFETTDVDYSFLENQITQLMVAQDRRLL